MGTLELTRTVVTGVGFASRSVGGAQMLIPETLQGKKLKRSKKVSEISKIKQNPMLFGHFRLKFVDASHQLSVMLQKTSQERNLTEEAFQKLLSE